MNNRQEILKHHNVTFREWTQEDIEMFNHAETIGGMTLEAIGEYLGVTRERVRQIEEGAMQKIYLNNPFIIKVLKADFGIKSSIDRKQERLKQSEFNREKKRKLKAKKRGDK